MHNEQDPVSPTGDPRRIPSLSLCCPYTLAPLVRKGNTLHGPGKSYPIINGVPDFLRDGGETEGIHTDYVISKKDRGLATRAAELMKQRFEEEYFALAEQEISRKLDVLDIGCGSSKFRLQPDGGYSPIFALFLKHARRYAGIEPSWAMLNSAMQANSALHRHAGAVILRGVGEALPFPEHTFDLIFINSSLDHCADASKALRQCFRVLRPGGFVLIALQNFDSWQRRLLQVLMPQRYRRHRERDHHTSPFNTVDLKRTLMATGYVIVEFHEFGFLSVSRYKLAWLETMVFGLPYLLGGSDTLLRTTIALEGFCERMAPGAGSQMVCLARRVQPKGNVLDL